MSRNAAITLQAGRARVSSSFAADIGLEPVPTMAFQHDPVGGTVRYVDAAAQLYARDGDELTFPRGLLPRVRRALRRAGYTVQVTDNARYHPELSPSDRHTAANEDLGSRRIVAALRRREPAQIPLRSPGDIVRFVRIVQQIYPRCRIAVACATLDECQRLAAILTAKQSMTVLDLVRGADEDEIFIAVGTFADLTNSSPYDFPIVVLPNALHAVTYDFAGFNPEFAHLWYAFRPVGVPVSHYRHRHLEARFGRLLPLGDPRRRLTVVIANSALPDVSRQSSQVRKQHLIWSNAPRNRIAANVATAIVDGDQTALARCGVHAPSFLDALTASPRTLLVSDNVIQARALAKQLRDWQLALALPDRLRRDSRPLGLGAADRMIATVTRLDSLRELSFDAIVNVTSEMGPALNRFLAAQKRMPSGSLVLVNFADDCAINRQLDVRATLGRSRRPDFARDCNSR